VPAAHAASRTRSTRSPSPEVPCASRGLITPRPGGRAPARAQAAGRSPRLPNRRAAAAPTAAALASARSRSGAGGPARCARPRRLGRAAWPPPRRPRAVGPGADRARARRPLPQSHGHGRRPRPRAASGGRGDRASALGATRLRCRQRRQALGEIAPIERFETDAQPSVAPLVVKTVELEEVPMQIVGALDVHRRQITFKTLEPASGESSRGRISPAAREPLRQWLERFDGLESEFVIEGTTGWRFVVEEIERAAQRAQAAREDRRRPLRPDAGTAARRRTAGGVDPARADPRAARARAVAQNLDRSAHRLATAVTGAALPPGRPARLEAGYRCRTMRL
jgi:hypothetical protein